MTEGTSHQIVIAGVGGQGVLFTARILTEAARRRGLPLTTEPRLFAQGPTTASSRLRMTHWEGVWWARMWALAAV